MRTSTTPASLSSRGTAGGAGFVTQRGTGATVTSRGIGAPADATPSSDASKSSAATTRKSQRKESTAGTPSKKKHEVTYAEPRGGGRSQLFDVRETGYSPPAAMYPLLRP